MKHLASMPIHFSLIALFTVNLAMAQNSAADAKPNEDLGVASLPAEDKALPYNPMVNMTYDAMNPSDNGDFVLYAVNRSKQPLSIDTPSVIIRAIGSESHELILGGSLFGDAKSIIVPAGEARILIRMPWKNLFDADTLARNYQLAKAKHRPGIEKLNAPHWTWLARPKGPDSPIYDRRGHLLEAATIWAEIAYEDRVVRSRPFMVIISAK